MSVILVNLTVINEQEDDAIIISDDEVEEKNFDKNQGKKTEKTLDEKNQKNDKTDNDSKKTTNSSNDARAPFEKKEEMLSENEDEDVIDLTNQHENDGKINITDVRAQWYLFDVVKKKIHIARSLKKPGTHLCFRETGS